MTKSIEKRLNLVIIVLLLLLLCSIGYYYNTSRNDEIGTRVNLKTQESSVPPLKTEFHFKTVNGVNFTVETDKKKMIVVGLENKIIFLKIFGWDCQYCKKEIPQLINLKKDLGDSFEIIAIEAEQRTTQESLEYIKRYGINYHIINGINQQRFYKYLKIHYGWNNLIPVTIVLGKHGKVLAYEVGAKSYNLSELMKAALSRDIPQL